MKRKQNILTDVNNKFQFKVEGLGGEEIQYRRLVTLRIIVLKPKTRKRHPLLRASKDLKSFAQVRQTPFRLQLTLPTYYLTTLFARRGIKNPIDEFVEVLKIARTVKGRKQIVYLLDVKIIDNMDAVKMMNNLHKDKKKKVKKKSIKKRPIKKKQGKRRKKRR